MTSVAAHGDPDTAAVATAAAESPPTSEHSAEPAPDAPKQPPLTDRPPEHVARSDANSVPIPVVAAPAAPLVDGEAPAAVPEVDANAKADAGADVNADVDAGSDVDIDTTSSTPSAPGTSAADATASTPPELDLQKLTFAGVRAAVDELDNNLDEAIDHAAHSIWTFATSVTGRVSNAVSSPAALSNLRQNVASRLQPLDSISRDISSQLGALAPPDAHIPSVSDSVLSVAESVRRNAEAMEMAILAKANAVSPPPPDTERTDGDARQLDDDVVKPTNNTDSPASAAPRPARWGNIASNMLENRVDAVSDMVSGSSLGQTVGTFWSDLFGGGGGGGEGEAYEADAIAHVPKTRFEKKIFELQANPDTYCEAVKDLDGYEAWGQSFLLDRHTDECIFILSTHDAIAELYERVVPAIVDEDSFWMRYYFSKHVLEMDEERRKKLLERADSPGVDQPEEGTGWSDDDWDDNADDIDADADANAVIDADIDADADAKTNTNTNTNANADADADAEVDDHADVDADAGGDGAITEGDAERSVVGDAVAATPTAAEAKPAAKDGVEDGGTEIVEKKDEKNDAAGKVDAATTAQSTGLDDWGDDWE